MVRFQFGRGHPERGRAPRVFSGAGNPSRRIYAFLFRNRITTLGTPVREANVGTAAQRRRNVAPDDALRTAEAGRVQVRGKLNNDRAPARLLRRGNMLRSKFGRVILSEGAPPRVFSGAVNPS